MIIRHDRHDADSLVHAEDWPAVVTFFDGDGAGTLIALQWIITAAHTARNIPAAHTLPIAGISYQIDQVVLHPDSRVDAGFFTSVDLGLVRLTAPVLHVRPLPLYTAANERGQDVLLLGRGDYGNGVDGVQGVDHRLRYATNTIDTVDPYWIAFRFDPPPDGTPLEGVGGEGDSGGPALIQQNNTWHIAGVSSWQQHAPKPLGTYGCIEHYARISTQVPWIHAIIHQSQAG